MNKTISQKNSTITNSSVNKPVFNIPASFLADTSLSSLAKQAFVEKNEASKKSSPLSNNKSNSTTHTAATIKSNQYTSTNSTTKKPLHLISLDEKLQMSNTCKTTTTTSTTSSIAAKPQTFTTKPTSNKKKTTPKKQATKENIPQISLEKSPSTPVNKDISHQGKHSSDNEVFSDCEELEDRATVVLLSARSKYSTTLTSPRSSVSLSSSASSDDCSSEAYQSSQKAKLLALDEEEEYQSKNTNAKLKKSNQKLKKRVQTLTEEHSAALSKLSKLQEELVSLKTSFEKQLEESKASSQKKVDILIDRTLHFKSKVKKTKEELNQIDVNVIAPLRESLEKKSAEFEAIIESMKVQLKEQHAQDEISWKRILNEKELDFTTKLELLQKEQQSALQTELALRSELEKIVESRTEEVKTLKHTFETIQQLLTQKKIAEQELLRKTKSREDELLELLHQKELENQRILQENTILKKQVETLSSKSIPKSVEAAEWKQQLAIPQRVEVDKSTPASLSVWKKMHGSGCTTNNALRGTLANFLNKC